MFGVGTDWPIRYDELDPFYQEAEELMGVAGEQGPAEMDPRTEAVSHAAAAADVQSGAAQELGDARRDRDVEPAVGEEFGALRRARAVLPQRHLHPRVSSRRQVFAGLHVGAAAPSPNRDSARAAHARPEASCSIPPERRSRTPSRLDRDHPEQPVEIHAKTVRRRRGIHLELASAVCCRNVERVQQLGAGGQVSRRPSKRAGLRRSADPAVPGDQRAAQPGDASSSCGRKPGAPYIRHDLRIWESSAGKTPRLRRRQRQARCSATRSSNDWRARTKTGDGARAIVLRRDSGSRERADARCHAKERVGRSPSQARISRCARSRWRFAAQTEDTIKALFATMAKAGNGKLVRTSVDSFQDHPAGGCRMGSDGATSVVDSWGRAHDHENLFVVGRANGR